MLKQVAIVMQIVDQTGKVEPDKVESYFNLISAYRKQALSIRKQHPQYSKAIDQIIDHVIGLNISVESYNSTSLEKLDATINRFNDAKNSAADNPHYEQFIWSLRDLYSKAIENIAMREMSKNATNNHTHTDAIVESTITMLDNLKCTPSSQKNDEAEILKYKKACAKQTQFPENFLLAVMAVTYAGLLAVVTLGTSSYTRSLQIGKSLFAIPSENNIKNHLLCRPSERMKPAINVTAMAKQFIKPPKPHSCGFFTLKSNKTEDGKGNLYNYAQARI